MEAYIKYKLVLGIEGTQTKGEIHEALGRERWGRTPKTPRLWEEDELKTRDQDEPYYVPQSPGRVGYCGMGGYMIRQRKTTTRWESYAGDTGIQLQETEQGALKIIWERHKGEILGNQKEEHDKRRADKVISVTKKRQTAECWGGEEYLTKWNNGEQRWVNKLEVMNMSGTDAQTIHKARELIAESIVTFTEYMKDEGVDDTYSRGTGGDSQENIRISEETAETRVREPYPTLYPGEVVGDTETNKEAGRRRQNMGQLTDRAWNNKHRQERRSETQREKRMRLAKGEDGTRVVSGAPERKIGGGWWDMPPRQEDTAARRLLGGQDGRGTYRVFKDDTMDLAHEKEHAGHLILRLFIRPEEMENGQHIRMSKRHQPYEQHGWQEAHSHIRPYK
eukprot:3385922-Pleurochrysis_carterae.AAC.1